MKALIITHGELGAGLVDAAEQILGPLKNLIALNNAGKSLESMIKAIQSHLLVDEPTMILIDFAGGSCHAAALQACREADLHTILGPITGINLPMLLTFLTRCDREKPAELIEMIIDRGKLGIRA
jgi:mannose/fructose-specific phosphotransferase system component IIA